MFTRMGLSNRLNIIIIAINLGVLFLVAFLANSSSASALRTQAITRFDTKADNAFESISQDLNDIEAFGDAIAEWITSYNAINISTSVNTELVNFLQQDNASLVYSISVLRPEGTVIWVSPTSATGDLPQTRLRVVSSIDALETEIFQTAMNSASPSWFLQDSAVFDTANNPTLTYAVPYQHETGNGMIWIDVLQINFDQSVVSAFNQEGLLLETIQGYFLILDKDDNVIDSENVNINNTNLAGIIGALQNQLLESNRTSEGLYSVRDPFHNNVSALVTASNFSTTQWRFIALLPESEIPVLPNDVYIPIILVGLFGIAILILSVTRFIQASVVQPLNDLGRSASEMGEGNLRFIVFHKDKYDEIGQLANSMDAMRDRLRESYSELESWSNTLEDRVGNRTEELRESRQQAEKTAQQLQIVYDESLSVVNAAQLQTVLDAFIDRILMLLDATYCAIWLLDDDRLRMRLVATNDTRRRIGTGAVTMLANEGIVGEAIQSDRPIIVNDYENYENRVRLTEHYYETDAPFSRGVCVPLKFAGFAIGAVVVGRSAGSVPFDAEAQRQLTLFTNMVSPSVRNAQLFSELQTAVREAERANEVKTRFLASVTHELRTPLNLIINNMDFMRVGAFGEVSDEQVSRLNQTVRSSEHLLYLINDLLDVSKIEAGEMQLFIQTSEVYTMLEDAVDNAYALLDMYDDKADKIELRIDVEDNLPEIPMDSRRIRQVLNNLLSNAIKFTQEGSVTLKVFQDVGGVHFSVHDTGMGIPQDEMPKLFLAFERTDAAKQQAIEGTGLGLPISKYLIQQHGSDLMVMSDVNAGTTFLFTLPFDVVQPSSTNLSDTQQISTILFSDNE
ncbi:MAG: hypothetical protein Phog2KO_25480 [Phototrophicaceae bacterium]